MEALGIEVMILPLNCMADYCNAVQLWGEKLGAKKAADQEMNRVATFLADLKKRTADRPRPRVMYVVWHTPMMLPGKQSFLTEWITLAGGESLGGDHDRGYFRAAPEWVIKMKPDILIFPGGERSSFPGWWKSLPAVLNGKVFLPEDESLFYRLSPRFDRALAELEKIIRQK
jgi:iron complex transport system substrate-binding protein